MNTTIKLALAFLVSVLFFNTNVNAGSYSGPDLSGQKVTISGPWLAPEDGYIREIAAIFEKATGATVEYGGSDSFEQQIVIDIKAGSPPDLAVNVQGVYYHYELGAQTTARDIFARQSLAGMGITLVFVDEDYLEQDPLGTTREALNYQDSSRLGGR